MISLAGLDPSQRTRRLAALARSTPRTLYLDDLDDPEAARALVAAGHRVVCAARRPMPGLPAVALAPWSLARLVRAFPADDVVRWDGLPLGRCSDAEILARLPDHPALEAAAAQLLPFYPASLGQAQVGWLREHGVLVEGARLRLVEPVRRALRARWSRERWQRHIRSFCDAMATWFSSRRQLADRDTYAREGHLLLAEAEARDLPPGRLLIALGDADLLDDLRPVSAALDRPDDPEVRAFLHHRAWLWDASDEGEALLHRGIALAPEAEGYELRVELAYHLYAHDRPAAEALLAEIDTWLEGQPAEAHPWIRNERFVVQALQDPQGVPRDVPLQRYLALAALTFHDPPVRLPWMRIQCLQAMGQVALVRDDLPMAIQAYERVTAELGHQAADRGAIDLLLAYTRRRDWSSAESLWETLRQAPLSESWDLDRRAARCWMLLGQGRPAEAASLVDTLPMAKLVWVLPRVVLGRAVPPSPNPVNRDIVDRIARAVASGAEADLAAVRALPACRHYSGASLAAAVEACRR